MLVVAPHYHDISLYTCNVGYLYIFGGIKLQSFGLVVAYRNEFSKIGNDYIQVSTPKKSLYLKCKIGNDSLFVFLKHVNVIQKGKSIKAE